MKKIIYITFFIILLGTNCFSQRNPQNIQNFDDQPYHFGFWLGYTHSSVIINRKADYSFQDSLYSINPNQVGSFVVGPIISLNFNQNIHLRSGLFLSFQDRTVDYVFEIKDTTELFNKRLNSVYTEIPLQLKLRTNRIGNVAFYGIGGAKIGYDWSSKIKIQDKLNYDDLLKLKRFNLAYQVGGGVDFFLPYFKFGIELRTDIGINNILYQSNNFYTTPIEKIRSQMWQLSFTFEG